MQSRLIPFATCVFLASSLWAQGGANPLDERIEVVLKNGSTILGVAPGQRFAERRVRQGYETIEDVTDRGAGIRIWYFRNQDGFIFLPYRSVENVDRLGKLTQSESAALRSALRTASSRKDAMATGPKKVGIGTEPTGNSGAALLAEFPPAKGWGPERYGDIQRRRIVLKETLTIEESRFVDSYQKWEQAWRESLAAKEKKQDEKPEKRAEPARKPLDPKEARKRLFGKTAG